MERQVDHLARAGVTTIVFSCGYRPREIEEYFGDGASRGLTMGYVVDPEPLGTAGAIANAPAPVLRIVLRPNFIEAPIRFTNLARANRRPSRPALQFARHGAYGSPWRRRPRRLERGPTRF